MHYSQSIYHQAFQPLSPGQRKLSWSHFSFQFPCFFTLLSKIPCKSHSITVFNPLLPSSLEPTAIRPAPQLGSALTDFIAKCEVHISVLIKLELSAVLDSISPSPPFSTVFPSHWDSAPSASPLSPAPSQSQLLPSLEAFRAQAPITPSPLPHLSDSFRDLICGFKHPL